MDLDLAIAFVSDYGDEMQIARLAYILHNTSVTIEVLSDLLKYQQSDGSFALPFPNGPFSSINETLNGLWRMEELGMMRSVAAELACRYLVSRQGKDGSWQEDPDNPTPMQSYMQDPLFGCYLSAYAAYWLAFSGYGSAAVLKKAAGYLAGIQKPAGNFVGFLHTTWLASSALFMISGPRDRRAKMGLKFLQGRLWEDWEPSQIAWALSCFGNARLSRKHAFITSGMDALEDRQMDDGSWASEDGEGFEVEATIAVIKAWKFFHKEKTA